jgi:hypothetical protein
MTVTTGLALGLFALSVGALRELWQLPEETWDRVCGMANTGIQVASAITGVAVALRVLAAHLARRASTPLPPPAPAPLATYRDGRPAECPRHPLVG